MPNPQVKEIVAYRYGDQDILQRVAEILRDGSMAFKVDLISADIDIGDVNLLNVAGTKINPATEETLQDILAALGGSISGEAAYVYDEVAGVASGSEETVVDYVVPAGKVFYLRKASGSGTNYASFRITVNGSVISTLRSHDGSLNVDFDFDDDQNKGGIKAVAGQTVALVVWHNRPWVGDFEGNLYGRLVTA